MSTGAGSTGWMSSIFNMQQGIGKLMGANPKRQAQTIDWDAKELIFVVREPFLSRASGIETISGRIYDGQKLVLESMMPNNGVVFSDGVEKDYIRFNSGTTVNIGISNKEVNIVMERKMIQERQARKAKKGKMRPSKIKSKIK